VGYVDLPQNELCVCSLELLEAASQEAPKPTAIMCICIEAGVALELVHGNTTFGIKEYERLYIEPDRERCVFPYLAFIDTRPDYFQRSDPAHDTCEIANENVSGLNAGGYLFLTWAKP
jgi:hypothetical protein